MCPQLPGLAAEDIVRRREMIFVNDFALSQVLAQGQLKEGTFFVNESSDKVYIFPPAGTDMTRATVEVATRPSVLLVKGGQTGFSEALSLNTRTAAETLTPQFGLRRALRTCSSTTASSAGIMLSV